MVAQIREILRLTAIIAVIPAVLWPSLTEGNATTGWLEGPKADIRLISATTAVGGRESIPLGIEVRLDDGWKTYWRSPGDAGIPPHVAWDKSANLASTAFYWPAPIRFKYYELETFGYEKQVVFPVTARLRNAGEALELRAQVDLLICDDVCIPHSYDASLDLPAGPANPSEFANIINRYQNQVPGDGSRAGLVFEGADVSGGDIKPVIRTAFRADTPFETPDLLVEGSGDVVFSNPEFRFLEKGHVLLASVTVEDIFREGAAVDLESNLLTFTLIDGVRSIETSTKPLAGGLAHIGPGGLAATTLLSIMALALIGGLILNLMPCVLPVISIKLLSVVRHGGGDPREVRLGFLATTAGIVVSFLALGSFAVGVKSAGLVVGWGIQFQQPLFVVTLVVILTLFAANMWGLFEVCLPGKVSDVAVAASNRNSLGGQFFQGAFAAVLATPCTAPFLGTSIGFALSRGALEIYAIFLTLGVGMALPFLLVAVFPTLASRLPRPGPWMSSVKKFLSFALIATVVWLLSVLAVQVSVEAAIVIAFLMATIFSLFALRNRMPAARGRALGAGVFTAAVLAFLAPIALPALGIGVEDSVRVAARDEAWVPLDEAAIPALLAKGNVVFVDVTADWCITCQVNKKRVLDTKAMIDTFERGNVILMRADWTKPSVTIARYLASFNRFGIPFNVIYGPESPRGVVLPELLSEHTVLDGLTLVGVNETIVSR